VNDGPERLPRRLGVWSAAAVLVGSTIGSGIFRVPAEVAVRAAVPGAPAVDGTAVGFGGGGYSVRGPWILGGEGFGTAVPTRRSATHEARLRAGYGVFRVGYNLLPPASTLLYPSVGIGGGALALTLTRRGAQTFGDALANPRVSQLERGMAVLDVGLALETVTGRRATRGRHAQGWGGWVLGLRAGYLVPFARGDWRQQGEGLAGGPGTELRGPYVRLVVGAGGLGLASPQVVDGHPGEDDAEAHGRRHRLLDQGVGQHGHGRDEEKPPPAAPPAPPRGGGGGGGGGGGPPPPPPPPDRQRVEGPDAEHEGIGQLLEGADRHVRDPQRRGQSDGHPRGAVARVNRRDGAEE
jgi:hypothetical protein